jgi:hypothetical protein
MHAALGIGSLGHMAKVGAHRGRAAGPGAERRPARAAGCRAAPSALNSSTCSPPPPPDTPPSLKCQLGMRLQDPDLVEATAAAVVGKLADMLEAGEGDQVGGRSGGGAWVGHLARARWCCEALVGSRSCPQLCASPSVPTHPLKYQR